MFQSSSRSAFDPLPPRLGLDGCIRKAQHSSAKITTSNISSLHSAFLFSYFAKGSTQGHMDMWPGSLIAQPPCPFGRACTWFHVLLLLSWISYFLNKRPAFLYCTGPWELCSLSWTWELWDRFLEHFLVNLHIRYEILVLLGLVNTSRKSPILTSITFIYLLMTCLSYKEHKVHQGKNHESISSNTVSSRPSTSDS